MYKELFVVWFDNPQKDSFWTTQFFFTIYVVEKIKEKYIIIKLNLFLFWIKKYINWIVSKQKNTYCFKVLFSQNITHNIKNYEHKLLSTKNKKNIKN